MRSFDRGVAVINRVPSGVARALADVDRGRGAEHQHRAQVPGLVEQLARRARVQSIVASSALEGVVVPDPSRADRIIGKRPATLRTRSEQELAGYRDAVDYVWQQDWRPLNVGFVLHLHRLLFAHTPLPSGAFKVADNLVVDRGPGGMRSVRFTPVSARQTPHFVDELMARYQHEHDVDAHHPLLLVGLLVFDLLVIHPFADGNGRVARILTNAALEDAGYAAARYVSLEQLVAESADDYYASLLASTHGWHAGTHDPWPWLEYLVRQVGRAYALFEQRARAGEVGGSKRARVRLFVLSHAPETFRIADVRAALPGISDGTIRNALDELRAGGRVRVDGTGRGATWSRPRS